MSGDYLFPPRAFVSGEPLEPVEINDALQLPGERLNGHLTQHNVKAPLDPTILADAGTFCRTLARHVDVDSGLGHHSSGPALRAVGGFRLAQETSWQLVQGPEPGTDLSIEIDTGTSDLILTTQLSHCYQGDATGVFAVTRLSISAFEGSGTYKLGSRSRFVLPITLNGLTTDVPIDMRDDRHDDDRVKQVAFQIARGGVTWSSGTTIYPSKSWLSVGLGWSTRRINRNTIEFTALVTGQRLGAFQVTTTSGVSGSFAAQVAGVAATTTTSFSELPSVFPDATTRSAVVYYPAQIQYALRVDGAVITETITGRFDNEQGAPLPFRVIDPRAMGATKTPLGSRPTGAEVAAGASAVGVYAGREAVRPDAINRPMLSVRLTATVPVSPGRHIVETVARRVPCGGDRSFRTDVHRVGTFVSTVGVVNPQPADSQVVIYNRQLSVTESPLAPVGAPLFGGVVTVPAFADGDMVSHQSLVDERVDVVVDALNEVKDYQVSRGAINGDHLEVYSPVLAVASADKTAAISFDSASAPYSRGSTGSRLLNITVDPLQTYTLYDTDAWIILLSARLSNTLQSGSVSTPVRCVLTVEGNVFLDRLRPGTGRDSSEMHLAAAAVCVGLYIDGVWKLWHPSTAWANSNDYYAQQPSKTSLTPLTLKSLSDYETVSEGNSAGDYVDIPFTATFVMTAGSGLLQSISHVGVFGSAAQMRNGSAADATVRVAYCSINAIAVQS